MTASLVISLDFELMWGVRDHAQESGYSDAVLGARLAIPRILDLFKEFEIRATWATVGLLMARSRDEIVELVPPEVPRYADPSLSSYEALRGEVGACEADDPLHFGASLLDQIAECPGQEIATHTFSHYYCLESGPTLESFRHDLRAAQILASRSGIELNTIVFPRNQYSEAHLQVCWEEGFRGFRGQPPGYGYDPVPRHREGVLRRGYRFLDSLLPIAPAGQRLMNPSAPAITDIQASAFLRPISSRHLARHRAQRRRICAALRAAASSGRAFHLWWHPHNFGRETELQLAGLTEILKLYRELRDRHGMVSHSMQDRLEAQTD